MWRYSWNGAGFLQQVIRPDDTCVSFYTTHWGAEFAKPIRAKLPIGFGMAIILCTNGGRVCSRTLSPKHTALRSRYQRSYNTRINANAGSRPPKSSPITWVFDPESFAPMGKIQDEQFYPIVTDYLGAPVAMFDPDGRKIWSADISIWGALTQCKGSDRPAHFAGQDNMKMKKRGFIIIGFATMTRMRVFMLVRIRYVFLAIRRIFTPTFQTLIFG